MDELIGMVAEKTGLSPDGARSAVETVLNYLKSKLPAALSSPLDQAASGEGGEGGGLGGIVKGLGGMFGKHS